MELPATRRLLCCDAAETGAGGICVGPTKHHFVQRVECIGAEFHLIAFVNLERLDDAEIPKELRISAYSTKAQRTGADVSCKLWLVVLVEEDSVEPEG